MPLDVNENYDSAFQIRLARRWQDVYVATGLKRLQKAMTAMIILVALRGGLQLQLSDVMAYLKKTAPADSQVTVNSFRKVLSF